MPQALKPPLSTLCLRNRLEELRVPRARPDAETRNLSKRLLSHKVEAGLRRLEAQTLGQDVRELQKDARTGHPAKAALITQPSVYLLCP